MQFVGRLLGHGLDPAREKHVFVYTVIVYNPKAPNAWFKIQKVRNNECDLSLLQHRKITSKYSRWNWQNILCTISYCFSAAG